MRPPSPGSGAARVAGLCLALLQVAAGCAREGSAAPPVEVLVPHEGAVTPTLALGPDESTTYIAWIRPGETGADVFLSRLASDGRRLGEPVRVNDRAADADPHEQAPAQLRVGPDGTLFVLWQKKVEVEWLPFGASELRFSRSLDGGRSFEPAITLGAADGPPARRTFHDLAIARDGTVYISWIDAGARDAVRAERGIRAERTARNGAHGAHRDQRIGRAGDAGGSHHTGAVADEPGTQIRVIRSTDAGRTFGPATVIDDASCPCCRTSLAVAPDGTVYVAYRKIFPGDVRDIAIARSEDGGRTFSGPVPVHRDGWVFPGCPHAGPSIAVDEAGTVHAAWYTGKEGAQGLFYASSSDGARSFGEPLALTAGEWVPPSHARLATSGASVWVAWDDRREEPATRPVRLARIVAGQVQKTDALRLTATGSSPELTVGKPAKTLAWVNQGQVRVRTLEERE
jgi:hypothetical protein